MLAIRDPAPSFSLPDQDGQVRTLDEFLGNWLLLFFYPEDDTPGCTKEACGFRDLRTELQKRGCAVVGVSADSVESHRRFADKYELPFILVSDEAKTMINDYGVWREKNVMGVKKMGIVRTSFLIDPTGTIVKIYEKVKAEEHPDEVLADLDMARISIKH